MKPLEALKRIRQETCPATILPDFDKEKCCEIIEKALKDYEETDNEICDLFERFGINNRKDLLDKLKAFDIIISKPYDIDWIIDTIKSGCDYETYLYLVDYSDNKLLQKFKLTKDEYELLKGVLK